MSNTLEDQANDAWIQWVTDGRPAGTYTNEQRQMWKLGWMECMRMIERVSYSRALAGKR